MALCQYSEKQIKKDFLYGEDYLSNDRYDAALEFYLRIYDQLPELVFINYRIGQCYYNMHEKRFKSIPFLEYASTDVSAEKRKMKSMNSSAPIETLKLLGDIYLKSDELGKAYNAFVRYRSLLDPKDINRLKIADERLKNIAVAYQLQSVPLLTFRGEPFYTINTRFSDYNPVLSKDESIVIYTSFWESADIIFMSEKKKGSWSSPIDISADLASDGNSYASSLTDDGKSLYLIKRGQYNSDICVSNFSGKKWEAMFPLSSKINSRDHEIDAFVTFDGKTLYFASNRKDGMGGYDLYKSMLTENDWDIPVNLGNIINTEFNEGNPYITPDNNYFIFSSDGHKSMGGKDLFFCKIRDDGTFSSPVNFGYPVNTTEDNNWLVYFNETSDAYYTRDTKDKDKRIDIFRMSMYESALIEAIENNWQSIMLADIQTDNEYVDNLSTLLISSPLENQFPEDALLYAAVSTEPETGMAQNTGDEPAPQIIQTGDYSEYDSTIYEETVTLNNVYENPAKKFTGFFTVQIMALKKYRNPDYFGEFKSVRVIAGPDGFYRYILGNYPNLDEALQIVNKAQNLGYKDAFVRIVSSIPSQ